MPPSAPMTLRRGATALLLLDLQRDFMDPEGIYARHGLPIERLRAIIPAVGQVARASRAAHVPIFASKFTVYTAPGGAPLGLDHIIKARPFLLQEGFRLHDAGRELIPELPRPDYELDKPRFSAFHGTALEVLLRSLDIDTVVLTGIVTHGGVEATARCRGEGAACWGAPLQVNHLASGRRAPGSRFSTAYPHIVDKVERDPYIWAHQTGGKKQKW